MVDIVDKDLAIYEFFDSEQEVFREGSSGNFLYLAVPMEVQVLIFGFALAEHSGISIQPPRIGIESDSRSQRCKRISADAAKSSAILRIMVCQRKTHLSSG